MPRSFTSLNVKIPQRKVKVKDIMLAKCTSIITSKSIWAAECLLCHWIIRTETVNFYFDFEVEPDLIG